MSKKGLIGVQMSTIAPAKMPSFNAYDTMARLTEIGYKCAEISQVPMTAENVAGFRRAIDELDFNISSVTANVSPMFPGQPGDFLSDPDGFKKMVDDARALDCDLFRIGMLPMSYVGSYDKAVEFAKLAEEYAVRLKEEGIDLYYHNHHVEFVKYGGEYLLDIIRANAPHLGFELDTHWIHRGGEDPVKFINQYAGRIRLLHLKDYRIGRFKLPEGGITPGDRQGMMKLFGQMNTLVEFAEVGEGSLDMPACIEAGLKGGSKYFLVEQDNTYNRTPFEALKISHDNLVKMGYGDWF